MKQTFKDGPNRERHFFCCAARRCKFFEWLDAQLPRCAHGAARLRRVLKMGPNNGRHFAACPAPKGRGCSLFEWVLLEEGDASASTVRVHGEAAAEPAAVAALRQARLREVPTPLRKRPLGAETALLAPEAVAPPQKSRRTWPTGSVLAPSTGRTSVGTAELASDAAVGADSVLVGDEVRSTAEDIVVIWPTFDPVSQPRQQTVAAPEADLPRRPMLSAAVPVPTIVVDLTDE